MTKYDRVYINIRRWWDIANARRCKLLHLSRHKPNNITEAQKLELELLRKIADLVISHASPISEALEKFKSIDDMMSKALGETDNGKL